MYSPCLWPIYYFLPPTPSPPGHSSVLGSSRHSPHSQASFLPPPPTIPSSITAQTSFPSSSPSSQLPVTPPCPSPGLLLGDWHPHPPGPSPHLSSAYLLPRPQVLPGSPDSASSIFLEPLQIPPPRSHRSAPIPSSHWDDQRVSSSTASSPN